jgi:flagellar assembly protein FliH
MKMPSLPESVPVTSSAQRWEPDELAPLSDAEPTDRPRLSLHGPAHPGEQSAPTPMVLFEVGAGSAVHSETFAAARTAAEAAGYTAGWAAGVQAARLEAQVELTAIRAAAQAEMDARMTQVNTILARVREAASAFERRAVPATEEIENLVVSTAFSVAESIVGASLRDDETRGMTALARALALSPVGAPAIIALNPQDHALLGAKATELAMGHDVQIIADPSLKPGDATVSSGATSIDARISAGLARVQEVLAR